MLNDDYSSVPAKSHIKFLGNPSEAGLLCAVLLYPLGKFANMIDYLPLNMVFVDISAHPVARLSVRVGNANAVAAPCGTFLVFR